MSIAEMWQSYAISVLPIDAPPVQIQETRRAFYAGAWAVLQAEKTIAAVDMDDEAAYSAIEALEQECKDFVAKVGTGGM